MGISKKEERLGLIKFNKWGDMMKIIEYNEANNIIVEFQDEWKETKLCKWKEFNNGNIINPHIYKSRVGKVKINNQGYPMKVIKYINDRNVIVEFQDEYHEQIKTTWGNFCKGHIKNHYQPSVYNIGVIGVKYPTKINGKKVPEYIAWHSMLTRCYTKTYINGENQYRKYEDVRVCDEWLLYENYYEWLHSQENFNKWYSGTHWNVDKDILIKGNKIYSPDTCFLVPDYVNTLFLKAEKSRGDYPIGVTYKTRDNIFEAQCNVNGKETYIGRFTSAENAFNAYKNFKENIIKQVAQEEYDKGNITKQCYEAMMNYQVEITD